jgi:hypothetical protein
VVLEAGTLKGNRAAELGTELTLPCITALKPLLILNIGCEVDNEKKEERNAVGLL